MEKIVNLCVSMMLEYGVINKKQRAIMIYGLDLLFSSIIFLLSFMLMGIILDLEMQTLCFFLIFIPLQSFGGGYHCQTHFRCWLLMLAGYLFSVCVLMNLKMPILWIVALFASYSFVKLAPIENSRAPFSESFRSKMHHTVVSIYIIFLIISAIAYNYGLVWEKTILAAVILSGGSIMCAKVKQLIN